MPLIPTPPPKCKRTLRIFADSVPQMYLRIRRKLAFVRDTAVLDCGAATGGGFAPAAGLRPHGCGTLEALNIYKNSEQ